MRVRTYIARARLRFAFAATLNALHMKIVYHVDGNRRQAPLVSAMQRPVAANDLVIVLFIIVLAGFFRAPDLVPILLGVALIADAYSYLSALVSRVIVATNAWTPRALR